MYINITGSSNNKDVYIYQSFRKENGKTSSHIYKKLGKMNDLLAQIDNDKEKMMEWARNEAKKETELYNQKNGKVSVDFSQGARIMKNEQRLFNVGYSSEARGQSGVFLSCFLFCHKIILLKNGYKNNSQQEHRFRLRGCPEDDTIFYERTTVFFGAVVLLRNPY